MNMEKQQLLSCTNNNSKGFTMKTIFKLKLNGEVEDDVSEFIELPLMPSVGDLITIQNTQLPIQQSEYAVEDNTFTLKVTKRHFDLKNDNLIIDLRLENPANWSGVFSRS